MTKAGQWLAAGRRRQRGRAAPYGSVVGQVGAVRHVFEQFLAGRGAIAADPIRDVDVRGLRAAMRIAGFVATGQSAVVDDTGRFALDRVEFVHEMMPLTVIVYSLVRLADVLWNRT